MLPLLPATTSSLQAVSKERDTFKKRLAKLEATASDNANKQNGDIDKVISEREEWKTKYDAVLKERAIEQKQVKVQAIATKLNFADPTDVTAVLNLGDLEEKDLEAAVKKVAEDKPHWIKAEAVTVQQTGLGSVLLGEHGTGKDKVYDGMTDDEKARAQLGEKMRLAFTSFGARS